MKKISALHKYNRHGRISPTVNPSAKSTDQVLCVDDQQQVLKVLQMMLQKLGYHVVAKNDSVQALDLFQQAPEQFALVITDIVMPKMNGIELAKKMMCIRPDIPIVFCSGYSDSFSHEEAKNMGISDYLAKPITMEKLASTIERLLSP